MGAIARSLKPMRRISKKRARLYRSSGYAEKRDDAVGDGHQPCLIQSPVCTGFVEHLHEPLTRARAGGLAAALLNGPEPIPCCDLCNEFCSRNPTWAYERGFLVHAWEATPKEG